MTRQVQYIVIPVTDTAAAAAVATAVGRASVRHARANSVAGATAGREGHAFSRANFWRELSVSSSDESLVLLTGFQRDIRPEVAVNHQPLPFSVICY